MLGNSTLRFDFCFLLSSVSNFTVSVRYVGLEPNKQYTVRAQATTALYQSQVIEAIFTTDEGRILCKTNAFINFF